MNIVALIEQVQAHLKPKLDVAVEFFPERPADYRLNHPKGVVLISYGGARFEGGEDITLVRQSVKVGLSLTVMVRQLNGKTGALALLDTVRQAMIGFRPMGYHKTKLLSDRFVGEQDGIWQYQLDVQTQSMVFEEQPDEPTITQITLQESIS